MTISYCKVGALPRYQCMYHGLAGLLIVVSISLIGIGCTEQVPSSQKHTDDNALQYQYVSKQDYYIPKVSSAHKQKDVLTVSVQMKNTTGRDLVIVPSLLWVNVSDSTFILPRYDAMVVSFFGMIEKSNLVWDDALFPDDQYCLQFIHFKRNCQISIVYHMPLRIHQTRKFQSINYMHDIRFPVWYATDTLLHRIAPSILEGCEFVFDNINPPTNGYAFVDPLIVNIGTESWSGSIDQVQQQDIFALEQTMAGSLVDSAAASMMVVSHGRRPSSEPKHVVPGFRINDELNKAVERAEQEAR